MDTKPTPPPIQMIVEGMTIKPKLLAELKKAVPKVRNVNTEHKENLSKLDKLALAITDRVGTMGFFFIVFGWTLIWLGWNIFAPVRLVFDPVPACVFWLFISNMIQIFLMPLLMIGQNLQSRHTEARAEADFEINTKAEMEIETVLLHLEDQNRVLQEQNKALAEQNKTMLEILEHLKK